MRQSQIHRNMNRPSKSARVYPSRLCTLPAIRRTASVGLWRMVMSEWSSLEILYSLGVSGSIHPELFLAHEDPQDVVVSSKERPQR